MIKWEQKTLKRCDESKCTSEIIHVLTALEPAEPRADLGELRQPRFREHRSYLGPDRPGEFGGDLGDLY